MYSVHTRTIKGAKLIFICTKVSSNWEGLSHLQVGFSEKRECYGHSVLEIALLLPCKCMSNTTSSSNKTCMHIRLDTFKMIKKIQNQEKREMSNVGIKGSSTETDAVVEGRDTAYSSITYVYTLNQLMIFVC